jgi:polyisoprenoid-binding protein YceI
MKKVIFSALACLFLLNANAQQKPAVQKAATAAAPAASPKFFTKAGKTSFTATSSMEAIEATTNKTTAVIDLAAGKIEVKLLVKTFHFEKALMEEHFNENYMESGKFPNAGFVGDITDAKSVNLAKDGTYPVKVKGKLTMHNITKDVETTANLVVKGGALVSAKSDIIAKMADYKIDIPGAVKDKIAKEAKISLDFALQPLK